MTSSRLVINRDGYVVDLETGEVVDDHPIDYGPEWRAFSYEDYVRRARAAPLPSGRGRPGSTGSARGSSGSRVVSVKLPEELLSRVDEFVVSMAYPSRAAVIREALEAFLGLGREPPVGGVELARLRDLYAARGFVYAARSLLAMARAYVNLDDFQRAEEELELLIARLNSMLNDLNKKLGLW